MTSQTIDHAGLTRRLMIHPRRIAVLFILLVAAMISSSVAIKEALVGGIDFQWSGAHLLGAGRDPWMTYLSGDKGHDIILGQQPNYLPELYELLLPLGAMQFSRALVWWCGLNLLMLACTLAMVCRLFKLDRFHSAITVLLTLCATPFRVTMSNGQHGILILFLMTLVYYLSSFVLKGVALGLSYSKYSFSPLLVLVTLLRRRWAVFFWSILPPLAGLLFAWRILKGNLLFLATEPLKTSKIAMGPGYADIMTTAEVLLRNAHVSADLVYLIPTLLGLTAALAAAIAICRFDLSSETEFAVVIVFTLFCFKHVIYDYVVLLVPLAFLLAAARSRARLIGLIAIGYFWFASGLINHVRPGLHLDTSLLHLASLSCLCFAMVCIVRTRLRDGDYEHS